MCTKDKLEMMGTVKKKPVPPRNLKPDLLGGVIFGCTDMTIKECLTKQLFGLPAQHFVYVKNIHPGLPLFLFNYSKRQLHGVFEAAGHGQMNINPYGWTKDGSERTVYPAQVQICVQKNCLPLIENQFQPIIKANYYTGRHFRFELDHVQVRRLIALFSMQVVAPSVTVSRTTGNWQIVNQYPSEQKTREEAENVQSDASVENTPYNGLNEDHTKSSSFQDSIQQAKGIDKEAFEKNEMDLIYAKLQMSAKNSESLDSYTTDEVKEFETARKMHVEVDRSHEGKKCQVENFKESSLLSSSDLQLLIAELQHLKTFKQESVEKIGHLQQSQQKLLSVVQQLQDRCTRLEAFSNHSETYVHGTMTIEEYADPDGLIYLVGGYDGKSWLPSLDSYSPSKDVIKSLKNIPSMRAYTSLSTLNGDLYVIGGGHLHSWYDIVESYNPANNDWTSLPCLNEKKGGLAATKLHEKIFAIGGGNGIHCFSDVEMFDIDVGRWICARSMLQKRFDLAAVELNGVIYVVGGYDGTQYLSSAERFDPREHSWSKLEHMKSKRGCHSLVVLNEKLYAIGGFDGSSMVASVEVFDPRHGTWMNEAPMNLSKGYSAAVVLSDCIYTIGGMGDNGSVLEKVERYKEGVGWQMTNLSAVGKRSFASAIAM